LGTLGLDIDDGAGIVDRNLKDAWGAQIAGSSAERFSGLAQRETDPESGLIFMRNRYYDPRIGRFTQADPILGRRATAHYAYASNNPVGRKDPRGLQDAPQQSKLEPDNPDAEMWSSWLRRNVYEKAYWGFIRGRRITSSAEKGVQSHEEMNQYFYERTDQTIQVMQGGGEAYLGAISCNPVLVAHGADLMATGVVGWGDGKVHQTQFSKAIDLGLEALDVPTDIRPIWSAFANNVGPYMAPSIGNQAKYYSRAAMSKAEEIFTQKFFPTSDVVRPSILLDENSLYMKKALEEAAWTVKTVPQGTKDEFIAEMMKKDPNLVLVTQNYKDFKGLPRVVRVGSQTPDLNTVQVLTSLDGVKTDPTIFQEYPQIPASGLNAGQLFPPKK
jgi:RHS repeat-associated protein